MRVCADEQLQWQRRLYGYLLKKDSPSCGMEDVKIWKARVPSWNGVGTYAVRLMENRRACRLKRRALGNPILRENFAQRVFVLRRSNHPVDSGLTFAGLIGFYAGHRLIIMSHDQLDYQKLGMMIAATTKRDLKEQALSYLSEFMNALKIRATR